MRILQMISSLADSGGAEMLVRNLSLDYVRRGHSCHVVYISDAASLGASAEYEAAFKARLDAAGIGHTALGHRCRRNPLLGGWRLRRVVARFRPDLFHVHLGYGLLFQACGLVRLPTVYTNHNIVFRFPAALLRVFDRFVDRYVAICAACEDLLRRHVGKPVVRIYNGVPADYAAPPPTASVDGALRVLSVGDLTAQKDYPTLVAAAAEVVAQCRAAGHAVHFEIAGGGRERAAIEAAIGEHGLDGVVRLLGVRRDVPELMAAADLLVLASRWEGLPITLIEAAMSGLPAVATEVGGNGEIVVNGVTGTLVPPGEPARLAEAVTALLTDPERRVAYGAAARERGRRFTLAACADAHLALYAELIGDD